MRYDMMRAMTDGIMITPEMREAGVAALERADADANDEDLVEQIYVAMCAMSLEIPSRNAACDNGPNAAHSDRELLLYIARKVTAMDDTEAKLISDVNVLLDAANTNAAALTTLSTEVGALRAAGANAVSDADLASIDDKVKIAIGTLNTSISGISPPVTPTPTPTPVSSALNPVVNADGSVTVPAADGSTVTTATDGSTVSKDVNGVVTGTTGATSATGSGFSQGPTPTPTPTLTPTPTFTAGSVVNSDGSTTVTAADGSTVTTAADGFTIVGTTPAPAA